jgi:gentisate 1,2-dioxygenase
MSVATLERTTDIRDVPTLDALYEETGRMNMTPGWVPRKKPILWHEPKPEFVPAHWRYQQSRAALDAAGRLIDVSLAERRNLVLRNPAPGTNFETTRTLVCAYQMILPGEMAPSHRHSSHALRVILDAKGSFSIVNGEKMPMETGDVVLTPGGCWHGHGHDGAEPAYWLDVLDVPLIQLLEPMFFEEYPERYEKAEKVVTDSPYRFKGDAIARGLDKAKADPNGVYGPRIELEAPDMPVMSLSVQRLPAGFQSRRHRSTANQVFAVMEGSGETIVGNERFVWERGDTFVVPTWTRLQHKASSDAMLFSCTDEPLMRFGKYYRFEAE